MPSDYDDDSGETFELDAEATDVVDTDDGGAIVTLGGIPSASSDEFYRNLAEDAAYHELSGLSSTLLELIDRDKTARSKRDEQYAEGIKRTGLGDEAPGGASFAGASKVVHPVLTEACVDFAARTIKELFPPQGPAKDRIDGKVDGKKLAKAKRKAALLNWQLTVQVPGFRAELEQLLTQVPLGGGQYLKFRWDVRRHRPEPLFVAIDDMLLPFAATNFYTAPRRTHVQYLTKLEYDQRVRDGMYIDADLYSPSTEPESSEAGQASDRVEGREGTGYNEDGLRTVYEIYATLDLAFDEEVEEPAPYIITIDRETQRVLAVYRNWDEADETREELQWFVEFPFIPWRGAYPIGLPQMIGGLSGAATGALRALLDSAHIQNAPALLKLKGKMGGQSASVQPGETVELEAGLNTDDIRKLAMPMPYNPPSATLFQLLGFVVEAAKGVVRTSLDDTSDSNPNAPVGTTLARIEQGLVVYSSVFGRLHDSMGRVLRILNRLNAQNLDDARLKAEAGELLASREDFDGPQDVVPVSDPNIFSEAQRVAQVQTIAQRAATLPQLYNARKVEERILATLKIPNADDLLNPPVEPKLQNAVNENVAASLGRPVTAFPQQDHLAHLQTHVTYLMSPMFGMNPLLSPAFIPSILNHIREHLAMWYAYHVFELVSAQLGEDIGDFLREMDEDEAEEDADAEGRALDALLAEATTQAILAGQAEFAQLPPIIQKAQELLQQMQPQQQQDPRVALQQADMQRKQAKDAQDAQTAQGKLALEQTKLQQGQQRDAFEQQMTREELAAKREADARDAQLRAAEIDAKRAMNAEDNQTALAITSAEIQTGERTALSTGTGINP